MCGLFRQFRPLNTRNRNEHFCWEQDRLSLADANNEYLYDTAVQPQHLLRALCWATAALTRLPIPHRKKSLSLDQPAVGQLNTESFGEVPSSSHSRISDSGCSKLPLEAEGSIPAAGLKVGEFLDWPDLDRHV